MREEACGFAEFRNLLTALDGSDIASDVRMMARLSVRRMELQRALMCIAVAEEAVGGTADFDAPEWRGPRNVLALLTDYFAARAAEGRISGDPSLLARILMGMMFQLVVARKLWGNDPVDPTVVDAIVDVFLNGVQR